MTQDSKIVKVKKRVERLKAGKSVKNHSTKDPASRSQQVYKHALLQHITNASAMLRVFTDIDALLKQIATIVQEAPGFQSITFYLHGSQDFYQMQTASNGQQRSVTHLQQTTLSASLFSKFMSDEYRIGQVYLIPASSQLRTLVEMQRLFVPYDREDTIVHSTSLALTGEVIVVPLIGDTNALLGLLVFADPIYTSPTTEEMLLLLTLFANQVAIILERTHLHEEIRRISEERVALIEVSHALSAPDALYDLQTVYHAIYEQINRLMPVDTFFIHRYDSTKNTLINDYMVKDGSIHVPPDYQYIPQFLNGLLWSEKYYNVFSTREAFAEYIQAEFAEVADEFEIFWQHPNLASVQSLMFISIKYGKEPVGVLLVQSGKPHSYKTEHLQMLKEIGIQAALAIKCTHIYSELREALEQAQESERLKNHFLMTASHELRTPLTAVQGYLELLNSFNDTLTVELKERFINNARRGCEELVLLLGNVMDASRIDQDKVELNLTSTHLSMAIRTIVEILEPIITKEERFVEIGVADQIYVWADDLRLRQILLNLLGNALKYTPASSSIVIRAEQIHYNELCQRCKSMEQMEEIYSEKRYALVEVQDWGPGIAIEDQARLFNKFIRLDGAINSIQRGAGLGLYLCRQLSEAMGGCIWIESTGIDGEGATFYVALPLA